MKRIVFACACLFFAVLCNTVFAKEIEEKVVTAPVIEAQLFKNGIAMVTQVFHADAAGGTYVVQPAPKPLHGTLWFHGDAMNSVRFLKKEVLHRPGDTPQDMLLEQLSGEWVDLLTKDSKTISGTIVRVEVKSKPKYDSTYNFEDSYYYRNTEPSRDFYAGLRYVLINTSSGYQYVSVDSIWGIQIKGEKTPLEISMLEPAMIVSVKPSMNGQDIYFSYLTKGIAWAPSYRFDILDDKKGKLSMSGSIKNEFIDMHDVQIHLISGFPNIEFANVTSMLWPETTLSRFFYELSLKPTSRVPAAMTQAVMSNNVYAGGSNNTTSDVSSLYSGDFDLHFQDAGKHTALLGESLLIPVATKSLEYNRILFWEIPDNRDAYGRLVDMWNNYHNRNGNENDKVIQDDVWDSLEVKNPFDFPMTTSPVSIYDRNGRFSGQTMTYWNAPGEKMYIKVTKALNMRVSHTESEVPGTRSEVRYLGYRCYKAKIEGKFYIHNIRDRKEKLRILKRFSGNAIEAERNPKITKLPEGTFSINERNEVVWTIDLNPGEKTEVKYTYWTYQIIW